MLPSGLKINECNWKKLQFTTQRFDDSFLRLRIHQGNQSIQSLRFLISRSLSELSALIDHSETAWIGKFCCWKQQQVSIKQREKHDRKLRSFLFSKMLLDNSGSTLMKGMNELRPLNLFFLKSYPHWNGVVWKKGLRLTVVPGTGGLYLQKKKKSFRRQLDTAESRYVRSETFYRWFAAYLHRQR